MPPAYCAYRRDRDSKGGGVALLFKKNLKVMRMRDAAGVEALFCKLFCESLCLVIGVVYRPPGADLTVLESLKRHITSITSRTTKLILCGDFNLPTINWSSFTAGSNNTNNNEELIDIAFRFDLIQLVKDYTRVQGNSKSILDLVFVQSNIPGEIDCEVVDGISDHNAVLVNFSSIKAKKVVTSTRVPVFSLADDVSILDKLELAYDEFSSSAHLCDVNTLWLKFKNTVHACIQLFVPFQNKRINLCNPWITREIIHLKRKINRLRKARKKLFTET